VEASPIAVANQESVLIHPNNKNTTITTVSSSAFRNAHGSIYYSHVGEMRTFWVGWTESPNLLQGRAHAQDAILFIYGL
jgi:hypothetical protein